MPTALHQMDGGLIFIEVIPTRLTRASWPSGCHPVFILFAGYEYLKCKLDDCQAVVIKSSAFLRVVRPTRHSQKGFTMLQNNLLRGASAAQLLLLICLIGGAQEFRGSI